MGVAGKKVADYPLLLAEWDSASNGDRRPEDTPAGSNKPAHWRCAEGHAFTQTANQRTNNGRRTGRVGSCPICLAERGGTTYWTWERIVDTARAIVEKEGHLPPAGRLQEQGYAMLVQCVYAHGKTWPDLREAVGSPNTDSFVRSRIGIRWRSHAEASLSNFLFARGVAHERGRKYPDGYSEMSGRTYGYYDLLFYDRRGRPIDVEVWGDKPLGHDEAGYAQRRAAKEAFNADRDFLGIQYQDCYSDERLDEILEPFIGRIEPHVFVEPYDPLIETSHWSNADELLVACRRIAEAQPDGKFPAEDWLRKRGRWAAREGPAYNTVSVYIKTWLGGIRNVRELLGQAEHSTVVWDRERALAELKGWMEQYGKSPGAVRRAVDRGKMTLPHEEVARGSRIQAAVIMHVGTIIDACLELGIRPSRRAPRRSQSSEEGGEG